MAVYKKMISKRLKRESYFKDGKNIKNIDDVPFAVRNLESGQTMEIDDTPIVNTTVPDSPEPGTPQDHVSIVSGEPATRRRFLNGKEYWLTAEEHRGLTLGKVAQIVREKGL